jgi:hypothetical protein
MTRIPLFALLPLLAAGCEILGIEPSEPWNGETIRYICHHGQVDYTHDQSSQVGTANPAVSGCYSLPDPETLPWTDNPVAWDNTLYGLCVTECSHQVDLEAAPLGRHVLGDTCYEIADENITWTRSNCDATADQKQQQQSLSLSYAPLVGDHTTVAGAVSYTVSTTKTGQSLQISAITLDDSVGVVTGIRNATALLGFPKGTTVSVDQLAFAPIEVALDRKGNGVISAKSLQVEAMVTITEPTMRPVSQVMSARLPFDIAVSLDKELTFGDWGDGFGGTFSIR